MSILLQLVHPFEAYQPVSSRQINEPPVLGEGGEADSPESERVTDVAPGWNTEVYSMTKSVSPLASCSLPQLHSAASSNTMSRET
ncbi:hypothetical protein E2562_022034 [Oryza meyeriana var. granulata]|uniref:Uncharacterized protein n=1 Tax=Oryza meyeriana var. granulata TaxID=110450 RepID=A0A6G1ENK0_9ORYZ|nr:hypothetical protein E2562_022034 [Oryza meyeriana var. granulata]